MNKVYSADPTISGISEPGTGYAYICRWIDVNRTTYIWDSVVSSRGLKWENKTYKLKGLLLAAKDSGTLHKHMNFILYASKYFI